MKKLILLLVFISNFLAYGLDMKTSSKAIKLNNEFVSTTIVDENGVKAAALKIFTSLEGVSFGNAIKVDDSNPGIYIVYIASNERYLDIYKTGYNPYKLIFSENGIRRLKSGSVYKIDLAYDKKEMPITIKTIPKNAIKIIDGKDYGSLEQLKVSQGKHELLIKATGFKDFNTTIDVSDKNYYFGEYELEEVEALPLFLDSNPKGADIYINDSLMGKTSKTLWLLPGQYNIELTLNGYLKERFVLEFNENIDKKIINLKKNSGTLIIDSNVDNYKIFINKKRYFSNQLDLIPGRYKILLSKDGYHDETAVVDIKLGKNSNFKFDLKPKYGKLRFSSDQLNPTAKLSDLDGNLVKEWQGSKLIKNIIEGDYNLTISKDGYNTIIVPVRIDYKKTTIKDLNLNKINQTKENKEELVVSNKSDKKTITGNYIYNLYNNAKNINKINGKLTIGKDVKRLDMPNLEYVESISISNNNSLEYINLPALKKIGNGFHKDFGLYLHKNPNLKYLNLNFLEEVKGGVLIYNVGLNSINIPKIKKIGRNLYGYGLSIYQMPHLKSISMGNLLNVNGQIYLGQSNNLMMVNMPLLNFIGKNNEGFALSIYDNKILSKLTFPRLKTIDGPIFMENNQNLLTINMNQLNYIGVSNYGSSIRLSKNGKINLNMQMMDQSLIPGSITNNKDYNYYFATKKRGVIKNSSYTYNNYSTSQNITEIKGGLFVGSNVTSLYMPYLTKVGYIVIPKNNKLKEIYLPNLRYITNKNSEGRSIYISNSDSINRVLLPSLRTTNGFVWFDNCKNLYSVNLNALQSTGKNSFGASLTFYKLPRLTSINLENLEKINGQFYIGETGLYSVNLDKLNQINGSNSGYSLAIYRNKNLGSIYIKKAKRFEGSIDIKDNGKLYSINFNNLNYIGKNKYNDSIVIKNSSNNLVVNLSSIKSYQIKGKKQIKAKTVKWK